MLTKELLILKKFYTRFNLNIAATIILTWQKNLEEKPKNIVETKRNGESGEKNLEETCKNGEKFLANEWGAEENRGKENTKKHGSGLLELLVL